MQPSPPAPATAGAVVEEVRAGWTGWARTVVAASASVAVLTASAALWEYGRRAGTPINPPDVLPVFFALELGGNAWLRRRTRRADLRWRRRLQLPGGVRPGLLARRWKLWLAINAVGWTGILGGGLVWAGALMDGWDGRVFSALCVVAVTATAFWIFKTLRHPTLVAVTSAGVVKGARRCPGSGSPRSGATRRASTCA